MESSRWSYRNERQVGGAGMYDGMISYANEKIRNEKRQVVLNIIDSSLELGGGRLVGGL